MPFDISVIRRQFPMLEQSVDAQPIVYLDSAASALLCSAASEAMQTFEETSRANVHRGMHVLAERATDGYEGARKTTQAFLGAKHPAEIIFMKNTTEGVNLVARSFGALLEPGDTVLVSELEHHSNIVPWQQLAQERGTKVEWIPVDDAGDIDMRAYAALLQKNRVKLVSITGQSNVLGTRPPLEDIIEQAHAAGARVLVDAAQLAAHHRLNVQKLDCDFLTFSGHKLYGPTGIGVLYAKRELLEEMPPFLGGGSMIRTVEKTGFTPADIPQKFEAGTPPIAQAIGLGAALAWLQEHDWKDVDAHEASLLAHARTALGTIEGITLLGPQDGSGCVSFVVEGVHPHDLTDVLGKRGICLRAGHHCTQPLHKRLGVPATTRLSVGIYNTIEEIDRCASAITDAVTLLRK